MPKPNDDELPPELQAEVDQIRRDEGLDPPDETEQQEAPPERVKLSRRQQKQQEEQEAKAQREARDNEILETARSLREQNDELRRQAAANAERVARMEGMLQATIVSRQQTVSGQQPEEESAERIFQRKEREATSALAAGKIEEYHAKMREANEALWKERENKILARIPDPRQLQQQQPFVKPDWVSAVEAQYPDVMMYQGEKINGQGAVVSLHNLMFGMGSVATPDTLNKAFERARKELGLTRSNGSQGTQDSEEDRKANERKRQMLAGGKPSGQKSGNTQTGGSKDKYVKGVPANWRAIAKANKMSEAQYLENFAAMNPDSVE